MLLRSGIVVAGISLLFQATCGQEASHDAEESDPTLDKECRLWLAPSHTGNDQAIKFGLFAGVDFAENETLPHSEIAVPLIDFVDSFNRDTKLKDQIMSLMEGFLWTAEFAGTKWEGNFSAAVAIPGIGILANYHSGTYNVNWLQGSTLLREKTPDMPPAGVAHPSRGAITPYYNLTFVATERIKAGMEIFANFGDIWDGNYTDDFYQDKLTRWDYISADQILDKVLEFMEKHGSQLSPKQQEDVLDFILEKILGTAAGKHAKVIRSLIPSSPNKLRKVKDMGGTFAYRNSDLVKSPKWLSKYGMCMDNLRAGPSTIPEAGRGAFATRKFESGDVITLSPMLHIPSKDALNMYAVVDQQMPDDEIRHMYDRKRWIGQQLIMNYCFSHAESSMLLFPIGSMVSLINHKSNANAYITWSKHNYLGNDHAWHEMSPVDIALEKERLGIVMRVVASRDIEEGEEIFFDYGPDWSAAWNAYLAKWRATYQDKPEWPLKALDMRELYKSKPFETVEILASSPYPNGILTACFVDSDEPEDGTPKKNAQGMEITWFTGPLSFEDYSGALLYLCDVQERIKTDDDFFYNYTVHILNKGELSEVQRVPHRAITFVDQPYTSDIHTKGAFRHWIGILDSHFPQAWRDLR